MNEVDMIRLSNLLEDNSSLKFIIEIEGAIHKTYKISLTLIKKEMPINLKSLPIVWPYSVDQIMDDTFYPD